MNDEEVEKDDSKSFYNQDSKSVMDMDIKSVIDFDMKSLIDIEVKSVIGQDTKENQDQSNLANLESYESMNRKSVKVSAQSIKSPEELINGLRLALKNNLPSESLVHALDELNELKSIVEVLNAKVQQNEVERVEMEIKMSNSIKL